MLVKVQKNGQVTIPTGLRTQAGIADGDLIEATFRGGKIILAPKSSVDRFQFTNAEDEYTPEQRHRIDARLSKALKETREGKTSGPFETHKEFLASLHSEGKKAGAKRIKRPAR